ncbi:MAG: hypothetical protein HGA80_06310, partial [Candidatus Omnitrophica bacterium]|nr:hypothetical protein [Candidatus Omnitrophota bacterium]
MNKLLINLLVLVLVSALGLGLLEAAVRKLMPWYDPARQVSFHLNPDGVTLGMPGDIIRQRTPKGDYDLFSRFNRYGFRDDKDLAQSVQGDIFVLGDSFSFGWGVADGQRYSDRLEQLLGRPVFNISIPSDIRGYQKLLAYARSRGARVSSLVLGLCMENDIHDYTIPEAPANVATTASLRTVDWRAFLKNHSAVYLAFSYELQKVPLLRKSLERTGLARDLEGLVHKNVLDEKELKSSRDEIMAMLRSLDKAVVLIIPSRMLWTGAHHDAELAVHERMVALLRQAGLEVVDMKPWFEKDGHPLDYYFRTDPHWNQAGHELAARALFEY